MSVWNTKEGVSKCMNYVPDLHIIQPVEQKKNLFAASLGSNGIFYLVAEIKLFKLSGSNKFKGLKYE
jgi:hypothetical protein